LIDEVSGNNVAVELGTVAIIRLHKGGNVAGRDIRVLLGGHSDWFFWLVVDEVGDALVCKPTHGSDHAVIRYVGCHWVALALVQGCVAHSS